MADSSIDRDPIERLAESFLARYRAGERPSIDEYARKYPHLAEEIHELLPALVELEQNLAPQSDAPATPAATASRAAPRQLGDYLIIREVGRGGMGVVYEAEQESLGRRVALKVLAQNLLTDPQQRKRFAREARAAARLHHTNIVPVFGVGEHESVQYYAMQFIHGMGLDKVLAELRKLKGQSAAALSPALAISPEAVAAAHPAATAQGIAQSLVSGEFQPTVLFDSGWSDSAGTGPTVIGKVEPIEAEPVPRATSDTAVAQHADTAPITGSFALPATDARRRSANSAYWHSIARIGQQVADALEHAHEQKILHRDIKPSNLLLDTRGTVWVTDFGLAKAHDQEGLTQTGDVVGTLRYMAPEMFSGKADPRSDVYSLGLTLFELLALKPAFDNPNRQQLIRQVLHDAPPRLREIDPQIPRDLETIVAKAIERDSRLRYQTAAEMRDDLGRFLGDEPILARRVSISRRFRHWCRRNPALASTIVTVSFFLAVTAVAAVWTAFSFRELAGRNAALANDKQIALGKVTAALTQEQKALADLKQAQAETERQRKQLAENVDLALKVLDEVYVQLADKRLAGGTELSDDDRRFLENVLPFYEQFSQQLEKGRESVGREKLALANLRVGSIHRRLNQFDPAEKALRRSVELWSALAEGRPVEGHYHGHLAYAYLGLADLLAARGNDGEAVEAYRLAAEKFRQVADASAGIRDQYLDKRRHVGHCWGELAAVLERQGNLEAAEAALRTCTAEYDVLAREAPEHAVIAFEQGHRSKNLAALLRKRNASVSEDQALVEPLNRYARAATMSPELGYMQEHLAHMRVEFAHVLQNSGRRDEAIAEHERAVALWRSLVDKAPQDPARRQELASALFQLSGLRQVSGEYPQALVLLEEARQILLPLTEIWRSNFWHGYRLAEVDLAIGQAHEALRHDSEADAAFQRAVDRLESLDKPGKPFPVTNTWGWAEIHWGNSLLRREDRKTAEPHVRQGARLLEQFRQAHPTNSEHHQSAIGARLRWSGFLSGEGRNDEALAETQAAVKVLDEFRKQFPEAIDRNGTLWSLSHALHQAGERDRLRELSPRLIEEWQLPRLDYRVRISEPGLYRLHARVMAYSNQSDAVFVTIPELADGLNGRQADWYQVNGWRAPLNKLRRFDWAGSGFFEGRLHDHNHFDAGCAPWQPLVWQIDAPGDYTIRFLMCEPGFSLDAFVLQRGSAPPEGLDELAESANDGGVYLADGGRITVEAEHFSSSASAQLVSEEITREFAWSIVRQPSALSPARGGACVRSTPDVAYYGRITVSSPGGLKSQEEHVERLLALSQADPGNAEWFDALAVCYRDLKDADAQERTLTQAIAIDPNRRERWRVRAPLKWKSGRYAQALDDLARELSLPAETEHRPERAAAWEYINGAWPLVLEPSGATAENYQQIVEWYDKAARQFPLGNLFIRHGMAHFRAGDFPQAVESELLGLSLNEAWFLGGTDHYKFGESYVIPEIAMNLALIHRAAGNETDARRWYDFCADWSRTYGNPTPNFTPLREEAEHLLGPLSEAGNPKSVAPRDGIELLSRVIELAPDAPFAYRVRAKLHRDAGRTDEAKLDIERAEAAYDRLVEQVRKFSPVGVVALHRARSRFFEHLGRWEDAYAERTKAIDIDPRDPQAWFDRAYLCGATNRLAQAVSDYSELLERDPVSAMAFNNRGVAYDRMGQKARAAADFARAVELDPSSVLYRTNLSKILPFLNRWEDAAQSYATLLELTPHDTEAWYRRGLWLSRSGHGNEAIAHFSSRLDAEPKSPAEWARRGEALARVGLYPEAAADLARGMSAIEARAVTSENAADLYHIALLLRHVGDSESYRRLCSRLRDRFGTSTDAEVVSQVALANLPGLDSGASPEAVLELARRGLGDRKVAAHVAAFGMACLAASRFDETVATLEEARRLEPRLVPVVVQASIAMARHHLGQSDNSQKLLAQARKLLIEDRKQFLVNEPGNGPVNWWDLLLGESTCRKARELIEGQPPPEEDFLTIQRARTLAFVGRLNQAEQAVAKARELEPDEILVGVHLLPHVSNVDVYTSRLAELRHQAESIGEVPAETRLELARAHLRFGGYLYARKQVEEGTQALELAAQLVPDSADFLIERGHLWEQLKLADRALADFSGAVALAPDRAEVWGERGDLQFGAGEWQSAIDDYTAALQRNPSPALAAALYIDRGAASINLNNLEEGIADNTRALELQPDMELPRKNRMFAHLKLGHADRVIEDCEILLSRSPDDPQYYKSRGQAFDLAGRYAEALRDKESVLRLAPQAAVAFNDLAWFLATCRDERFRDPPRALELARQAVRLAPKAWEYRNTLGIAQYRAGRFAEAIEMLAPQPEAGHEGNAFDWYFLAMALWKNEDQTQARHWYGRGEAWHTENSAALPKVAFHLLPELESFRDEARRLLGIDDAAAATAGVSGDENPAAGEVPAERPR